MGCCFTPLVDGVAVSSASASALQGRSLELDMREQTQGALANGTREWTTATGLLLPSTIANVAAAGTIAIEAIGMHFAANATASGLSTTTTNATHVYFELADLYTLADVDATWDLLVRIYAPTVSIPTNVTVSGGGLGLSMWGLAGAPNGSAARMLGIRRSHSSGVDTLLQIGAASSYNTAVEPLDVFGIINAPGAVVALAGNWDIGDDTWSSARTPVEVSAADASSGLTSGYRHADFNRVVLSFGSGSAAADMDAVVERMRFDFVPRIAA